MPTTLYASLRVYASDPTELTIKLFTAGTLLNTGGDTLTHIGNGYFSASVAETIADIDYDVVFEKDSVGVADSVLYAGQTVVGVEASSDVEITVLPLSGAVDARVAGTTIKIYTLETVVVAIAVTDSEGEPVTVTGLDLYIVVEGSNLVDKVVIANASITKTGSTISFVVPEALSAIEGDYRWALRKSSDDALLLSGPLSVVAGPQVDS